MPITIKAPITLKSYLKMQVDTPKMYLITIINEKYVPWEFCMRILRDVFHKNIDDATLIANEIVTDGEGFCGGYSKEIAETKAELVEKEAKEEGFSIVCLIEEV